MIIFKSLIFSLCHIDTLNKSYYNTPNKSVYETLNLHEIFHKEDINKNVP